MALSAGTRLGPYEILEPLGAAEVRARRDPGGENGKQDWTKERGPPTCERLSFPMNRLRKLWPHVITPHGRVHFAATRSANRVAPEIDEA